MPATWREQESEILMRQFRFCASAYRHADAEQKRNPTLANARSMRLCREAMVKAAEELRQHYDHLLKAKRDGDLALHMFGVVQRQFGQQNNANYQRRYSSPLASPRAMPKR